MPGKTLLTSNRSRLKATFSRIESLSIEDLETRSDFARYLCVLVSGFVETAVSELAIEYCKMCSSPAVSNYVQSQLTHLQNVKAERLLQLVGSFNPQWRTELEVYIDGSRKDALDSVVDLRNKIAHGESVSVTYIRIKEYYKNIDEIIDFLEVRFEYDVAKNKPLKK